MFIQRHLPGFGRKIINAISGSQYHQYGDLVEKLKKILDLDNSAMPIATIYI